MECTFIGPLPAEMLRLNQVHFIAVGSYLLLWVHIYLVVKDPFVRKISSYM
jgi:hypothetical protein